VRAVIDYRPALRERSGVGEYTSQLAQALLRVYAADLAAGTFALSVFSSSWSDRLRVPPELAAAAAFDRRVPVRLLNFAWHRLGWPSVESLTGAAFDVAHSLHPLLMPARDAAQVITVHDLDFLAHPERTRAEIRRDYPALARRHAHRADRIIVPSRFTAEQVERQLGVAGDKIAVCSPGAPDWTPRSSTPRDGYVLFFGTLEPRKNVDGLLDAYARLIDDRRARRPPGDATPIAPTLLLAGKATADAQIWLDRIGRPPLAGLVRHAGYIEPANRRALYEGARLLVQPSFEEGFGIPVLEAMTLGVPVVAANRGALPEVLGDAGLLTEPDAPALAAAIDRMLTDDALAARSAAAGAARAAGFSWETTARQVHRAYEQAIEQRRCASA
jgi:glycosyltransferase involved in cell wall biosynthesis